MLISNQLTASLGKNGLMDAMHGSIIGVRSDRSYRNYNKKVRINYWKRLISMIIVDPNVVINIEKLNNALNTNIDLQNNEEFLGLKIMSSSFAYKAELFRLFIKNIRINIEDNSFFNDFYWENLSANELKMMKLYLLP